MKRILLSIAATAVALGTPASAKAQALEGKWTNPKRSVVVNVARCGEAYCGTVSWASDKNKAKVSENGRKLIGTRILSDLRPAGNGLYKGRAFEPKRNIRGSATVRQVGPNTMVVKGCAVLGMLCREQRWTRVS
ncbi:MAG TPA: DUF2147 domain-containing protein [Sphingomicrobium sp.]|jgi:uncharacterized protein (DUF2147 family)